MRLLEREHPLQVLRDHASSAADGRGSVVMVAGDAGIGKSALLRSLVDELAPTTQTLWGMCDSLSTPRPLGPLRDIAAGLGDRVTAVLHDGAAQHVIFAELMEVLRERPRVIVVEDLHWADGATLDLVRFVGRRIADLPLVLAVSYRDASGPADPLRAVLGDLVGSPGARRLQLTPLSVAAVTRLVEPHGLDPADIHRRTGGNPFFVSQILAQPDSPLPASVRDAVLARTAGLTSAAHSHLELLSTAPDGVSAAVLSALGIPPGDIRELAARGLLDPHRHGVAFRHEIARSAVLSAVAAGSETDLHAIMIQALESVGADASVLAHHAVAAGDGARVLRYAPLAAADASRSGAHREALTLYEIALSHTGDSDVERRATLLERRSTELYLTDQLDQAIDALQQALELRGELSDRVAVGTAHRMISGYQSYAANRAAAERHDRAAVEILGEAGDARAFGFALANHAYLAVQRGDVAEAVSGGTAAQRIADDLQDSALHGTASIPVAVARILDGDLASRADLLAARDVGLRHHLDELATSPMSNLAHLDVEQGRLVDSEEVLAEALRISEERNVRICGMWQRGVRARLRLLQDRWSEADEDARAVLAAGRIPLGRLWPHHVLGLILARRDAPPDNPHLDEFWRIASGLDEPGKLAAAAAALAEQAWIARRPDPRLDTPRVGELFDLSFGGHEHALGPLRRWTRRLAHEDIQRIAPADLDRTEAVPTDLRYERAMALWDGGSTEQLLAALPLLDQLDARAVAARFRARLRQSGVNSVPRGLSSTTRANPAGLTGRQLDVLALLVDGLNNADIADRLVISRKTADHHVSAILAKLNVRSRGEAVAAARRLRV